MNVCIKCGTEVTSRWYAGPVCNKCHCKARRTTEFAKRQAEYDAKPERVLARRSHYKIWSSNNKEYLHSKRTSEEGRTYFREYAREWRKRHAEELREYRKVYKSTPQYKAKDNDRRRRNYEKDPGKYKAMVALRRVRVKQAMPSWTDLSVIVEIYRGCPAGKDVDHIIPIKHPGVSGLHVPWNLQYLTEEENSRKKNKFDGTKDNEGWRGMVGCK